MQWDFQQGDRVELLSSAGTPTLTYASGRLGTVLRGADRNGRHRYLVRVDQVDELYGLYWLAAECLRKIRDRVA
jgi:hypothetical protein